MVIYTFLPPIVLTGLVFAMLGVARLIGFGKAASEEEE
jgi:hypothetical protein